MVDPKSCNMTAFYTLLRLLCLTALLMGYTNSPAEFQKCMTFILAEEIPEVANIFIDDLPIKGLQTQYLDEEGKPETLSDNPRIHHFVWEHAQDIKYAVIVGQKCTPEGRLPEDDCITKVLNWPIMKTVKEVRGFLGLCGTVRIWIRNYSQLARPLTELICKNANFEWTNRCQNSFDTLKELVSSAPALRPIDYASDKPVILSVDTSYIAVGFILSQIDENDHRRPALVEMDANSVKGIINNPDI
ncbi:hypothetical protein Hypma_002035 [Hypsizygus marmoreus]|uniref:Reverse transcriptase/retrotransposon-derived protein RNase H-like domain-containing protein n=1 Tax=Hypsizygus marmoreus TaxID=39966 RepID=A0A369J6M4_HYPMA|nr:hypothetical protein Hypma_002035 [Hypsizygus marmoreus]